MKYFKLIVLVHFVEIIAGQSAFDCGRLKLIENDIRTRIPWVVSIFLQETPKSSYNFYNAGVIVGPSTILTVFPGVFGQGNYKIPQLKSIFIIAGTNSTLPALTDRHSVLSQVNYILPYSGHSVQDNQDYHYVLLHLKQSLNIGTPFVRKICIPPLGVPKAIRDASSAIYDTKLSGFIQTKNKRIGKGFNQLDIVDIKLSIKCDSLYQKYYKGRASHVFCGNVQDSTKCSIPGNSIFVEFGGKAFLAGLTALVPHTRNETCNKDGTHFFSDLYPHLPWIIRNVKCSPNTFACGNTECLTLEKVCNNVRDCPNGEDEGQKFCTTIAMSCLAQNKVLCHLNGKCVSNRTFCN